MKVVKLSHPNYEYDVHSLVKAFYAEDQVTVITPETKPEKLAVHRLRQRQGDLEAGGYEYRVKATPHNSRLTA